MAQKHNAMLNELQNWFETNPNLPEKIRKSINQTLLSSTKKKQDKSYHITALMG